MKIPSDTNLDRHDWEALIDRWIFNEEQRKMLKRNLLDGGTQHRKFTKIDGRNIGVLPFRLCKYTERR